MNNDGETIRIALAMIVKGSKSESDALYRCLQNVLPHVDGAFITVTHEKGKKRNRDVDDTCALFNENGADQVSVSDFEWCDDFAKARNFNFSQVPAGYTHILWCDADDVFRGLERMRSLILKNRQADGFGMWYLYHFDEYKQPDVVHKKTMIARNNGFAEWRGMIHEDLIALRDPNMVMIPKYFDGGIDRMHITEERNFKEKNDRNLRISKRMFEENGDDPRSHINYANSLGGAGRFADVVRVYEDFIDRTGSEEDRFIAHVRLSEAYRHVKDRNRSIRNGQIALGMRPEYPDGYLNLGMLWHAYGNLDEAEKYLLMGLKVKPKYSTIVVYNPRDYDYNPMKTLVRIYSERGRPDLGLPFMKACLEIYPNNARLKEEFDTLKSEVERLEGVVKRFPEFKEMTDAQFRKAVDEMPVDLRSHPGICSIYNQRFVKKGTNGREISIYCYPTAFEWNPDLFLTRGFGGSEEAIINLSRELGDAGWDVTVYNNCGPVPRKYGRVWWKPFWTWNSRDEVDGLIIWRSPKPLDFELGAKRVYLDLHDVVPAEEFTEARLAKLDRIFVKTRAHRGLFPGIPDSKFAVIPNGVDLSLFGGGVKKDPFLMINTSSPDRSMDSLPELFAEVRKRVPQARCVWAYGWGNYDDLFKGDPTRMKWKEKVDKAMNDAGIEAIGKIPQSEVAKLYERATILAYPSEFFEIDCISVKKAQFAGCVPVTTDFAAFDESVQFGVKIPSSKTNSDWCLPYQYGFGITDPRQKKAWVDACVEILTRGRGFDPADMRRWANRFEWKKIASKWDEIIGK